MTESSLRLYVVVPACSAPTEGLAGLRGAPVVAIAAGAVAAWTSRHEQLEATREDLMVHHGVVQAAFAHGPCVPVRFGVSVPSESELRAVLGRREAALVEQLRRLAGTAEISITLEWFSPLPAAPEAPAPPHAGPGRRFLEQRRALRTEAGARQARAQAMAQALLSTFGLLDKESVKQRICPSARVALSCAVLFDAARCGPLMDEVRRKAAAFPDVRLHLAGPWPPYSFSTLD